MPTCESDAAGSSPRTRSSGFALALGALDRRHLCAPRLRICELVQEEAAQRSGIARVAREERALDRLRQVDEPEDRPVEIGEVRSEALALLVREGFDREWQAFHGGHGIANASAGLGRNVRVVVSHLAARLLSGRARPEGV